MNEFVIGADIPASVRRTIHSICSGVDFLVSGKGLEGCLRLSEIEEEKLCKDDITDPQ